MHADDTTVFLNGNAESFHNLFELLHKFALFSGCKINLSKSEAIHIGSLKGSTFHPLQEEGLQWKDNSFKALGILFSLNTKSLYELNYVPKLVQIEHTLNCWKHRNLSLLGKIAVVKALLLPQLIFIFTVLCFNIPQLFFKRLNSMHFKFIWKGG